MKTRNYLWALALPAMLTACSQEEFTTENSSNGNGLNLVENPIENFSLKVEIGDGADTRVVSGSDGKQKWEVDDKMGLVWITPKYWDSVWNGADWEDVLTVLDRPEFFANNRFTIKSEGEESVWYSDANTMEGKHFAYFPYQTEWGEGYLQTKGGQERLKVYNTAEQEDVNGTDRLKWMLNHQTMLSPTYEFLEEEGTTGFSDERRVTMYLFSNRLNIQPKFTNLINGLKVYGYELKTVHNYNTVVKPFVTEAYINANALPASDEFGGCNWASMDDKNYALADFYEPNKLTDALKLTYSDGTVAAASAPKFTFLFLPLTENAVKYDGNYANVHNASKIVLVAHTNYGDITIEKVTGQFNSNSTKEEEISLSELYYNGAHMKEINAATTYKGFVGNAGVTRGAAGGDNGNITATFDCSTIEFKTECVKNNATLNRVLRMIANYKKVLGDDYKEATITLCENVTFKDLALTELLEQKEEELGVDINITGKTWVEDGTAKYSKITWTGESSIAQEIPNTNNYVEGKLTADVNTTNGLTTTYVLDGGTLDNLGTARAVTVEEGGQMNNDGMVKTAKNFGTVYNNPATTDKPEDQPTINELYNYATTYNYANINKVMANNNEDGTHANSAKIVLKNNPNPQLDSTLGSIFRIGHVAGDVMDADENNIEYTVENNNAIANGKDFATALNNKATNIFVADGVDIDATSYVVLNGQKFAARVTFKGKSTYTMQSSSMFDNALKVAEVVLDGAADVTFKNQLAEGGYYTNDTYALAADRIAMNDGSKLELGKNVLIAARNVWIQPNSSVTIASANSETGAALYYLYIARENTEIKGTATINEMPDEVKEYFGWI